MRPTSLVLGILALSSLACSAGTGPSSKNTGQVQLAIATASRPAASPALAPENYSLGGTTLSLTKVQLVLREIELKRLESSTTCIQDAPAAALSSGSEDHSGEGEDHCEEFSTGPVLLDLPLNGVVDQVVTINADTGTYRKLEFKVHVPGGDPLDQTFLTQHPDFTGVSIRAEGTWNGTPFVYTTDLSAKQEVMLVPPLSVAAAGNTDVTIKIDLHAWFLNGAGTAFLDPATANKGQPNEGTVKENIKRSFDAFEDDDHDGERDH